MIRIKQPLKLQRQKQLIIQNERYIKKPDITTSTIRNDYDVNVTKTLLMITMQMTRKMTLEIYLKNEHTEPSDEEEINQFTSDNKQVQETNNNDESNDDTDAGSEEEKGKMLNEDKGDRQVED